MQICKDRNINSDNCAKCKRRFWCWTQKDEDPTLLAKHSFKPIVMKPDDILTVTFKIIMK